MPSKAIITFLGTAGTYYNKFEDSYEIKPYKAEYHVSKDINLEIKEGKFYSTFPLLLNFANNNKQKLNVVALYTNASKKSQKVVLNAENLDYDFENGFLIRDTNNHKNVFNIINKAISDYDEIIFDVSHGFRSLPILAIINLVIENVKEKEKIKNIIFAQEIVPSQEYELIDLIEYLDIANISFALTSFIQTLKIPDLNIEYNLYKLLKNFSIHLTSNQFKEIFENDIIKIEKEINLNRNKLFFINELLNELDNILNKIKKIENKNYYEKFIFFSEFFLEKEYYLHASAYLIEGLTFYFCNILHKLKITDLNYETYENQQILINLMKLTTHKKINLPNEYFIDINYKILKKFGDLRNKIADVRHNLAHININQSYSELENELKELLNSFKDLIKSRELENLDFSTNYKKFTLTYQLERLDKIKNDILRNEKNIPKLDTLFKSDADIDKLSFSNKDNYCKIKEFVKNYRKYYDKLNLYKKNKQLILNIDEIKLH